MMIRYYFVILFFILFSCNEKKTQERNADKKYESITGIINNEKYRAIQSNEENLFVLNEKNDTVYKHPYRATLNFEFKDFNEDRFLDLLINQMSNSGGLYELVLYNNEANTFIPVENFTAFPSPEKIKETKFYYSYHKSGCADSNWDSDLFIIENYKAIKLGNISGRECETETKRGIFIYKVNCENEILIKEVPIEKLENFDKSEFIEKYWNDNYKKF